MEEEVGNNPKFERLCLTKFRWNIFMILMKSYIYIRVYKKIILLFYEIFALSLFDNVQIYYFTEV